MAGVFFVDTFFWIALAHPRDAWHRRVVTWQQANSNARFVTTEEVLSEVLTWFAPTGPTWRAIVVKMARSVMADVAIDVVPQTSDGFNAALALYEARPDKEYSLVDCRSMVAMQELGISDVLTNDHHFTQEGFTILFP